MKNKKKDKRDKKINNSNVKLDTNVANTSKKLNKKKKYIFFLMILLSISCTSLILYRDYQEKKKLELEKQIRIENLRKEKELIKNISSHYNSYVKTKENVNLYNDKEEIVGSLHNAEITLEEISIDKDTMYFKIKDFENAYVKYDDVEPIEALSSSEVRYKNYVVFNQNIITNDITVFYDEYDNQVYEFNRSFDLPIIIKDLDKYGVEFNNRLLYVKNTNVKEVKNNHNTDTKNSNGVAVLNYHAFYDENNYEEKKNCQSIICHSKAQFKTHLDYLKENNIFTLTAKEIEMYIDGKIQLPKSVYITIDDGPKTEHAVNMLTEYKMNATIFIVTNWFNESTYYKTEYIELHSHSHDLHGGGYCPGGQGGAIKCMARDKLLADLKQSRLELGGSTVFCYPFYEYNNYSISVLKEAGFTMAFAGEYGDMLVKVGMDKFRLPRFVIMTTTTMNSFDNYFKQIKN